MTEDLTAAAARIVGESGGAEVHWTVVLDRALKAGAVPPNPDAKNAVLKALAAAAAAGLVTKVSAGTYRASGNTMPPL